MPTSHSADERVFTDEALGFELFWQKHKSTILISLAGAAILILAAVAWMIHRHSTQLASEAALMAASTADDYRQVVQRYAGFPAGQTAQMLLGAKLVEAGDHKGAAAEFQSFLEKFPKSSLAGPANIALASLALADGQQKRGLELLNAAGASSDAFTAQVGLFFKARELAGAGDYSGARNALQLLGTAYGMSPAAQISRGLFQQIAAIEPKVAAPAQDSATPTLQINPAPAPSP